MKKKTFIYKIQIKAKNGKKRQNTMALNFPMILHITNDTAFGFHGFDNTKVQTLCIYYVYLKQNQPKLSNK